MYDRKTIRRRRAVLAVFIALSIAILTAYFGESGGGLFHTLQRGAQEAFAQLGTELAAMRVALAGSRSGAAD